MIKRTLSVSLALQSAKSPFPSFSLLSINEIYAFHPPSNLWCPPWRFANPGTCLGFCRHRATCLHEHALASVPSLSSCSFFFIYFSRIFRKLVDEWRKREYQREERRKKEQSSRQNWAQSVLQLP